MGTHATGKKMGLVRRGKEKKILEIGRGAVLLSIQTVLGCIQFHYLRYQLHYDESLFCCIQWYCNITFGLSSFTSYE